MFLWETFTESSKIPQRYKKRRVASNPIPINPDKEV